MIPSSAKGATLILTEQPLPEDCVEPVGLLLCVGEEKVSDNLETLGACKKAPLALLTPRRGETTAEAGSAMGCIAIATVTECGCICFHFVWARYFRATSGSHACCVTRMYLSVSNDIQTNILGKKKIQGS